MGNSKKVIAVSMAALMAVSTVDLTNPSLVRAEDDQSIEEMQKEVDPEKIVSEEKASEPALSEEKTTGIQSMAEEQDEQKEEQAEEVVSRILDMEYGKLDEELRNAEDLLNGYFVRKLLGEDEIALLGTSGYDSLTTEKDRNLYNYLKEKIEQVAAGTLSSTAFEVPISVLGLDTAKGYTAEELGVDSLTEEVNGRLTISSAAVAKMRAIASFNASAVFNALYNDCPYDMYWFTRSMQDNAYSYGGSGISYSSAGGNGGTVRFSNDKIAFTIYVDPSYRAGEDKTSVDVQKTGAAIRAAENAKAIAAKYEGKSTYEKIEGFKNEICKLVSYNNDAIAEDYAGGGDPWQVIYVFDQDADTNVVCEGYAKAFQYLCDLSGVTCYTVTGTMSGGTGAGAHMWNIVPLKGKNYLADVTNTDTGTVGQDGGLFLAGTTGSVENGYVFQIPGQYNVTYMYSTESKSIYSDEDLTLADTDYVDTGVEKHITAVFDAAEPAYTYGDTIQVNATVETTRRSADAEEGQAVLVNEAGEIVSDPVTVNEDGTVTLQVSTTKFGAGPHSLKVKYEDAEVGTIFTDSMEFTVAKKALTATINTSAALRTKVYDGTKQAPDGLSIRLNGIVEGDTVTATAGKYEYNSADVADATTISATGISLNGSNRNYTLANTTAQTAGNITKADAPAVTNTGKLTVVKGYASIYTFDVATLFPTVEKGKSYGTIQYQSPYFEPVGTSGYYTAGASVDVSGRMTIPVNDFEGADTGTFGSMKVKVVTGNYKDFTISVELASAEKAKPSLTVGTIVKGYDGNAVTIPDSFAAKDGDNVVPGTFRFKDGAAPVNVKDSGTYTIEFVPDDSRYAKVEKEVQVSIIPVDLNSGTATVAELTYDGSEQTPKVSVDLDGNTVDETTDYTVKYMTTDGTETAVKEAGDYKIVIEGTGNYTGRIEKNFSVRKAVLTIANVMVSGKIYDGTNRADVTSVEFNGLKKSDSISSADYAVTAEFSDPDAGEDKQVTGQISLNASVRNYELSDGWFSAKARISTRELSEDLVQVNGTFTYDSTAKNPVVTVKYQGRTLVKGTDYTVRFLNNVNAGQASAVISGTGNWSGEITKYFTIQKKDITEAQIVLDNVLIYDGNEQTQGIRSVTVDGMPVTYTVEGNKATEVGSYTLTIKGTGNFTGTASKQYTISKAAGSGTVSMSGWTYGQTANEPVPESDTNGTEHVTYQYKEKGQDDSTYSSTVPVNAGEYTVKAIFAATKEYGEATATVDFTIAKAVVGLSMGSDLSKTYGDASFHVTAVHEGDGTVRYESSNQDVLTIDESGNVTLHHAGTATITAVLSESANYLGAQTSIQVTVGKKQGSFTVSQDEYQVTYGTADFSIAPQTKDGDGTVEYSSSDTKVATVDSDGKVHIVGAGDAVITMHMTDGTDYIGAEKQVTIRVAKADGTGSVSLTGWIYGQSPKTPSAVSETNGVAGVTYQYKEKDAADELYTAQIPTDAGNYTVKATFAATENYNAVEAVADFTISKAAAELTLGENIHKTYGDGAFTLTPSCNGNGTVHFVSSNPSVVSVDEQTGIVTILGAGTATITARVDETANYLAAASSVTVTVAKKQAKIQVNPENAYPTEFTYTGNAVQLPLAENFMSNSGNTAFNFSWKTADGKTTGRPVQCGGYILVIQIPETADYTEADLQIPITIRSFESDAAAVPDGKNEGTNGWYHGNVTVKAPEGYQISRVKNATASDWSESVTIDYDMNGSFTYYLKQNTTGYVTDAKQITVKRDTTAPTATVSIKGKWWEAFLEKVTLGIYTKDKEMITVTATDEDGEIRSGIQETAYYISSKPYEGVEGLKELKALGESVWKIYNDSAKPVLDENSVHYVYIRVKDMAGNISYVSTDGLVYDAQATNVNAAPPALSNNKNVQGWSAIIATLESSESDSALEINMNGTTKVPGNVFTAIRGRSVQLSFNLENGIKWIVNGEDISAENISEQDLSVSLNSGKIPEKILNAVTGADSMIQFTGKDLKNAGVPGKLHLNAGAEMSGKRGSLFVYNSETGKLEFAGSDVINANGDMELSGLSDAEYVLVIAEKEISQIEIKPDDPGKTDTDQDKKNDSSGSDKKDNALQSGKKNSSESSEIKKKKNTNVKNAKAAKTGDATNAGRWAWLLGLSGMGVFVSAEKSKKRKKYRK